jgi:hypothetical protein
MTYILNLLTNLNSTLVAIVLAFGLGSASGWYLTAEYKNNKHEAMVGKMQNEANIALRQAVDKLIETERNNAKLANEIEVSHVENRKKLDDLFADNLRLASEYAGMYDRYATNSCSVSGKPDTSGNPNNATSGARLSDQASGFLLNESRRADEAAAYAAACYEWVKKLK